MRRPWGLSRQKQTVDIVRSVMCTAVVSVAVAAVAYIYAPGVHLTMFCIHINCRYMWQSVYSG
jgi:hypothetical protein